MSMSTSNIRVFVQWSEQTVFAGEDVECQIVFRNVAAAPGASRKPSPTSTNGPIYTGERQRRTSTLQDSVTQFRGGNSLSSRPKIVDHGPRPALSLNIDLGDRALRRSGSSTGGGASEDGPTTHVHRRSVSIMSIGMADTGLDETNGQGGFGESSRKMARGHERTTSLHSLPRRTSTGANGAGPSSGLTRPYAKPQSPQLRSPNAAAQSTVPDENSGGNLKTSVGLRTPGNMEQNAGTRNDTMASTQDIGLSSNNFKFPAATFPEAQRSPLDVPAEDSQGDKNHSADNLEDVGGTVLMQRESAPIIKEHSALPARILSPMASETPRSSGEFYSLSNNSTETLASEYVPQQSNRSQYPGTHTRQISNLAPSNQRSPPETLMMGYAQIYGSFSLDGSLVNQAPFEEVKRKGVLGGQGGGVIGVETKKGQSSLLRSFGWGNLGESLGGLLGGSEMSSIKDMRGIASSKSIPLLSTPQSILFVDLKLAPGESRSFKYAFKLPRGLPPTHRGKAIKISYNLVLGIQRPGGAREQQVKCVDVPFRVLGSVNEYGELLGHDLMSPYIILLDSARVQSIPTRPSSDSRSAQQRLKSVTKKETNPTSSLEDFLVYVDELLTKPRQNSSLGLLSPTDTTRTRRQSSIIEAASAKEVVDMAILRSNLATESQRSANRFEIARSGKRVAVIMLARPAYRMGETVTAVIDFTDAEISCYALHASLETSEMVDPAIALRSEASIHRVTRKIHASHSESALFARRIVFSATIPATATPTFITSGVSLDWKILVEFVTPQLNSDDVGVKPGANLLEEISRDERGVVLVAAETVDCESFEIAVPLRVYGALAGSGDRNELQQGLVI